MLARKSQRIDERNAETGAPPLTNDKALGMILNDEIKIVPIILDALSDKNDTRGRLV